MERDHGESGENCNSCDNNNTQNKQHENAYKGWACPMRQPTKSEERKMFVELLSILIKVLMNNHVYTFDGKVWLQEGKGSTGDQATGIITEFVMIWWMGVFKQKLDSLKIKHHLLERFVDDINGVFDAVPPGTKYHNGEISLNRNNIGDHMEDDERTMKIIQLIANDIDDMIVMTIDLPSKNADKKLPVLDLKVWLNEASDIEYEFYEKPMKNGFVVGRHLAIDMKSKRSILTQEVFRVLHKTRSTLPDHYRITALNRLMLKLKTSGYKHSERFEILKLDLQHMKN